MKKKIKTKYVSISQSIMRMLCVILKIKYRDYITAITQQFMLEFEVLLKDG